MEKTVNGLFRAGQEKLHSPAGIGHLSGKAEFLGKGVDKGTKTHSLDNTTNLNGYLLFAKARHCVFLLCKMCFVHIVQRCTK